MENRDIAIQYLIQLKDFKFKGMTHPFSASEQGMGCILIELVENQDNVTAKSLAEKMDVSMARVTALIQKMEEKNLIKRTQSPTDGRVSFITLTDQGRDEAMILVNRSIRIATKIVDELGKEEIDHFLKTAFIIKDIVDSDEDCQ